MISQKKPHKLGRGRWDLASCQVLFNSVQRFQRRSRKFLSQSEARAAILFFRSTRKNTNLVEDVEILLPVKVEFRSRFQRRSRKYLSQSEARAAILFLWSAKKKPTNLVEDVEILLPVKFCSAVSEEKSKISQPIRGQGGHLVLPIDPKNTNLVEDVMILVPANLVVFRSAVSQEKVKMSQQLRGQGGHLVFSIGPKNTNLVEDVEILLPVKFRWISFSGYRGEVENVSANQRPGRPSWFSD